MLFSKPSPVTLIGSRFRILSESKATRSIPPLPRSSTSATLTAEDPTSIPALRTPTASGIESARFFQGEERRPERPGVDGIPADVDSDLSVVFREQPFEGPR